MINRGTVSLISGCIEFEEWDLPLGSIYLVLSVIYLTLYPHREFVVFYIKFTLLLGISCISCNYIGAYLVEYWIRV